MKLWAGRRIGKVEKYWRKVAKELKDEEKKRKKAEESKTFEEKIEEIKKMMGDEPVEEKQIVFIGSE